MRLKKQAKQARSIATVSAIVEAATYILLRDGPGGYTANRVAERAGVNIASFYQYFPNKEALLFHIIQRNWEEQLARLTPILGQPGRTHALRLRDFIREFFLIEAAEAGLRGALRLASVDIRDSEEFRALMAKGYGLTRTFIAEAVKDGSSEDLEFIVNFVVLVITSFGERTTDAKPSSAELIRQADLLSEMLTTQFGIA